MLSGFFVCQLRSDHVYLSLGSSPKLKSTVWMTYNTFISNYYLKYIISNSHIISNPPIFAHTAFCLWNVLPPLRLNHFHSFLKIHPEHHQHLKQSWPLPTISPISQSVLLLCLFLYMCVSMMAHTALLCDCTLLYLTPKYTELLLGRAVCSARVSGVYQVYISQICCIT